jgi:hypothetical protein
VNDTPSTASLGPNDLLKFSTFIIPNTSPPATNFWREVCINSDRVSAVPFKNVPKAHFCFFEPTERKAFKKKFVNPIAEEKHF